LNNKILSIGEILWDSLPKGLFLGGAPFNVACHLRMLGHDCKMISRVGHDLLGEQTIYRLRQKGMITEFIQLDHKYRTGFVEADLDVNGNAAFKIIEPAAWDFIELNEDLTSNASVSQVLIYGSLAQRNPKSAFTINTLRKIVPITVFDVNLRPPYDNSEIVKDSLQNTRILKLNDSERAVLSKWFNLPSALKDSVKAISESFGIETICVTLGENGAVLFNKNSFVQHPGFRVKVKDTVGSGDAFLAALISGILAGDDNLKIIEDANAIGAYVASCDGATPDLNFDLINEMKLKSK
jgi:fructokinase